jgi:hypothetical protein
MTPDQGAYDELSCYTLTHGHPSFIHQHVVDAHAAQAADPQGKPVTLTMALVGLYLAVERSFSGRQVQLAHMALARATREWPAFVLPENRGTITAREVMAAPPGAERDAAIHAWCASVWQAFIENRPAIVDLLERHAVVHRGAAAARTPR